MEGEEKKESTNRDKLLREKQQLEDEIREYGSRVSDAQIWHKRARIAAIDKELAGDEKAKQFAQANDKLKSQMSSQNTADLQRLMQQNNGGMAA
jgi:hypothetical protein